jgi:hypothetical protein
MRCEMRAIFDRSTTNYSSWDYHLVQSGLRAEVHGISAPGLFVRPYFHRYTEDAVDLCDVFSSFSPQGKATLHEISRIMGLPGKPKGFDGGEVERYFHESKIKEIAEYCETDVLNTYQVWLRYGLFRGTLSPSREAACCARVPTGHAAAAPPSVAKNFVVQCSLPCDPAGWGSFMQ